jgi:ABC-type sulfate transport system permease component
MATGSSTVRHTRGFDVIKPLSVVALLMMMLPLILLPLASIFIFGMSAGFESFWSALTAPDAIFALRLSVVTSFWATIFNILFGLFAAYVLARYTFWGRNAMIVLISIPTAIPTAVAGFALLLLWGPYGLLGQFLSPDNQIMFTPYAIILANYFRDIPAGLSE